MLSIFILNQKNEMSHGVSVVQRFAPSTTQSAFDNQITQAPTNHKVIIVTTVLL